MNFAQLHEALRLEILRRIESGHLSGKALASKTGFSQPHISNFLNRRKLLSIEGMDLLLRAEGLSVRDLLPGGIANPSARSESLRVFETVPLVTQATAITSRLIGGKDIVSAVPVVRGALDYTPIPTSNTRRDWERFVAIRITGAQAAEMQPVLTPNAILVIDRHYVSLKRRAGAMPSLYAVNTGAGLAIRYVTLASNRLILRCFSHADPVAFLEPAEGQPARELIVGRVCFVLAKLLPPSLPKTKPVSQGPSTP